MELKVWDKEGKVVDTITLEDRALSDEDYHLLYLSVKAFLDNQRLGTAKTKSRGEVRGGGKKALEAKRYRSSAAREHPFSYMEGGRSGVWPCSSLLLP